MATDIRNFLNGTGIKENNLISKINLFPNPSNEQVKLTFELKEVSNVKIELFDISGRLVSTVSEKKNQVGEIVETINTNLYSEGAYLVKINANGNISQQKLNIWH